MLNNIRNIFLSLFLGFSTLLGANYAQVVSFDDGHLANKARILIVPGHEPDYGGAEFGSLYERDLTAELGKYLQQYLSINKYYDVSITRDKKSWSPIFVDYFKNAWGAIKTWEKSSRQNGTRLKARDASTSTIIQHIKVSPEVALRLYGISKWANDNSQDAIIHLHINDAPDRSKNSPGKYSGIAIYIPSTEYGNSSTTMSVANSVYYRLSTYNPTSDLPGETSGIIADPELIAIGANNTVDAASLLIEYNYIYEPQFVNSKLRSLALKDLAYQTYLGLQDFFQTKSGATTTLIYQPATLYKWKVPIRSKYSDPRDIYSMQTALIMSGNYPPEGKTKNDCPHTGIFGPCTEASITEFQIKNGISEETADGLKTFKQLNRIYNNGK